MSLLLVSMWCIGIRRGIGLYSFSQDITIHFFLSSWYIHALSLLHSLRLSRFSFSLSFPFSLFLKGDRRGVVWILFQTLYLLEVKWFAAFGRQMYITAGCWSSLSLICNIANSFCRSFCCISSGEFMVELYHSIFPYICCVFNESAGLGARCMTAVFVIIFWTFSSFYIYLVGSV
jgi:hypothetical protein